MQMFFVYYVQIDLRYTLKVLECDCTYKHESICYNKLANRFDNRFFARYNKEENGTDDDFDYTYGKRTLKRILYSSDGLIFATEDHYQTFYEITE